MVVKPSVVIVCLSLLLAAMAIHTIVANRGRSQLERDYQQMQQKYDVLLDVKGCCDPLFGGCSYN